MPEVLGVAISSSDEEFTIIILDLLSAFCKACPQKKLKPKTQLHHSAETNASRPQVGSTDPRTCIPTLGPTCFGVTAIKRDHKIQKSANHVEALMFWDVNWVFSPTLTGKS